MTVRSFSCQLRISVKHYSCTVQLAHQMCFGDALYEFTFYLLTYLSRLLHDDLHWLDVPERIRYKIGVTVHRRLQSKALKYLIYLIGLVVLVKLSLAHSGFYENALYKFTFTYLLTY